MNYDYEFWVPDSKVAAVRTFLRRTFGNAYTLDEEGIGATGRCALGKYATVIELKFAEQKPSPPDEK